MVRALSGTMKLDRSTVATALYAIIAMYFFFMILDRVLSVTFGFNFQPYGSYVPPGFTLWGHLANGSMALFVVWAMLKIWDVAGCSKHPAILRAADIALFLPIFLWIPYHNDATHLILHGCGDVIPLYAVANAIYVAGAGVAVLRFVTSTKWRLILLVGLFATFLFIHFVIYAPMFPEFQWT